MAWRELGPDETSDLRQDLGSLVNRWIRRLTGRADGQAIRGSTAEDDAAIRAVQALLAPDAPNLDHLDRLSPPATNGQVTNGQVTNGHLTDGQVTNGQGTNGQATNGQATNGDGSPPAGDGTRPAPNGDADGALFTPADGELSPAELAVTHLARLNTLHSLQAAVQDRIDKLVYDAGQAGAGYPDIARALQMTRQNARKRWPEAVHHGPGRRPKREQPDI